MKKLLIGIGAFVVLVIAALVIVPLLIPAEIYEDRIERAATDALGRQVTIDGAPTIRLLPTSAAVNGLTVANAEGFSEPHLLRVDSASIGIRLLPLLRSRVEITRFDLEEPDIRFEMTEAGGNWELGTPGSQVPTEPEEQGEIPADISLGDVRITDGRVSFTDPEGRVYVAEDADITVTLNSLDEPLTATGTMVFEGDPARMDVDFSTPRRYAENGDAELALAVKIGENAADTTLLLSDPLAFEGEMDLDFPALRNLVRLVGADLGTAQGFERLRLAGPVTGNATRFAFGEGTAVTFDQIEGSGTLAIDTSGPRPAVEGQLTVGTLDLTPYLPPEPAAMTAVKAGAEGGFPAWSEEPMDFSALAAIDMDLTLAADGVVMPGLSIGETAGTLTGQAGDVTATVARTALYGGTGSGAVGLDVTGAVPRLMADFQLNDVIAAEAARELAGITNLTGRGSLDLRDLRASGTSQAALVDSLSGSVELSLEDGAIKGVNLGRIGRIALRTYDAITGRAPAVDTQDNGGTTAQLLAAFSGVVGEATGPSQETDFSSLDVMLAIENGIARPERAALEGPYYALDVSGRSNLAAQTVALQVMAAIAPDSDAARRELPLPIEIGGTFGAPSIRVDYQSALGGAVRNRLGDALKERGVELAPGESLDEALAGTARREVGKALGRALGGTPGEGETADGAPAEDEEPGEEPRRPEDALIEEGLNQLFGTSRAKDDDGNN